MSSLPVTPRQHLDRRKSATLSIASDGFGDMSRDGEGMESLADELADVWDEDGGEEEEAGSSFLEGLREGSVDASSWHDGGKCNGGVSEQPEIHGVGTPTTPSQERLVDYLMESSPTRPAGKVKRDRGGQHARGEWRYDRRGSDYGDGVGVDEAEWMSPRMVREIAKLEALARGLDDDSVSEAGGVIPRTTAALKDLGGQASIEQGVSRMITAYTSIAGHRTHKGREIFSMVQLWLRDRYPIITDDEINELISELDLLLGCLHVPSGSSPLQPLQTVIASTADLGHSLRSLSDLVQESRQAASAASRRLKNVKDLVMELRQDEEAREEGIRYLERGEWDRRIGAREAQSMCGDVVAGFETTCDVWRTRLFGNVSAEATRA